MGRFHYSVQRHYGKDRSVKEISEADFVKILSVEYCRRSSECGLVSIVTPDEEKAKRLVRSMKRSVVDMQIFSCADCSLYFRKDPARPKERTRDSSKPDPIVRIPKRCKRFD